MIHTTSKLDYIAADVIAFALWPVLRLRRQRNQHIKLAIIIDYFVLFYHSIDGPICVEIGTDCQLWSQSRKIVRP